jgi:transcriptional regulator with XRE-family HTH domain
LVGPSPGEIIGRNVRTAREAKLFSRPDLAKRSGLSLAGIDHLERGLSTRPRRRTIEKLANALDVDIDALMEGSQYPLGQAPASQDRLFDGVREREAFIERCESYVAARVAHYDNRLAVVKRGGLFPGFGGAKTLQDDAFEEFSQFRDLTNGELEERWLGDPEVPDAVKEELGFDLVEVQKLFLQVVGRIGDAVKELAETESEKEEAERRDEQHRERTRDIGKSA